MLYFITTYQVDLLLAKCHIQQKISAQRDVPEFDAYHSQPRPHHPGRYNKHLARFGISDPDVTMELMLEELVVGTPADYPMLLRIELCNRRKHSSI